MQGPAPCCTLAQCLGGSVSLCASLLHFRLHSDWGSKRRRSINDLAAKVRSLFQADADLSAEFNHTLANGKWDHMMDQTHLGYTSWQEPPKNVMPEVREVKVSNGPNMGVAVEGSVPSWQNGLHDKSILCFDAFNRQQRYIGVFNRGNSTFDFEATATASWIVVTLQRGTVVKDNRLWVTIDWDRAPSGNRMDTSTSPGPMASGRTYRLPPSNHRSQPDLLSAALSSPTATFRSKPSTTQRR